MILGQILPGERLQQPLTPELAAAEAGGIAYDSRRVRPGDLFFAFPGAHADGREFARDALARGAVAVVAESPAPRELAARWIAVDHGRKTLALAARNFYGKPDERLGLTGITGTNGKTTTAYLIDSILRAAGKTTAMIGTIEYHLAGRVLPAVNTTPESLDLMRLFSELEQAGGTHATMEVSSHALDLGRVYGLQFHTVVFTNLTRDHLDYHHTMEAYFAAKQTLFKGAGGPPPQFAVLNRDDGYARQIKLSSRTEVFWYGLGREPNLRARHIASGFQGLRFDVQFGKLRFAVESPLLGKINVYNILAACGAGLSYGIAPETVASPASRLCLAGSNAWTKASRSWSPWTMRIPTMRCATPSRWLAAWIPSASSRCSDAAAIATAPSGR
jgi:UDP-N-acetylmuramoyl-L-alanyl-D-glutamate--2,6-diaminopimelate ligase